VTYRYYTGVLAFLQEDYAKVIHSAFIVSSSLTCYRPRRTFKMHGTRVMLGHRRTSRKRHNYDPTDVKLTNNESLILTYLIPCRLITAHAIPSAALLAGFPSLAKLIGPLVSCIKNGDLTGFDRALADGEPEFVRRRIFLTLERSRDIALRNLLRISRCRLRRSQGRTDREQQDTEIENTLATLCDCSENGHSWPRQWPSCGG
jgi:hypothetical protein